MRVCHVCLSPVHILAQVSDITHEQYGQYLSMEELQSYMQADPALVARIASHFERHGVVCGDW